MDKALVLSLWFWSQLSAVGQETPACASYRQKRPTHTTCSAVRKEFKIASGEVDLRIDDILSAHNHYRSQLALGQLADFPPAANMVELRWDKEMSDVALALARQGTDETGVARHDLVEDRFTYGFPRTGQNVLTDRSRNWMPSTKWHEVIMDWFDQNLHYDVAKVGTYEETLPSSDAFAQVAWAATWAVGCGYAQGEMTTLSSEPKRLVVYVCNYGPAGNELNRSVYLEGPACSRCPRNTRCNQSTGLCVLLDGVWSLDFRGHEEPPQENMLPTPSTPAASSSPPTVTPSSIAAAITSVAALVMAAVVRESGDLGITPVTIAAHCGLLLA
ncbi:scoloptoxin SSD552-like [Dermacentor andersoni]|uniref:scoloptoxin SSD552-like n=1 Tax=Dermacentor andersoni TaxID=34620 RepID=UPI0021558656|nr:cysteine-rich venom protein-like [Dermacentor andersoni]